LRSTGRRKVAAFAALAVVCLGGAGAYVALAGGAGRPDGGDAWGEQRPALPDGPLVLFRSLDRSRPATYGEIGFAPLDSPAVRRTNTGRVCERVHYASGRGVCLAKDGALSYRAIVFDAHLRKQHELALSGFPSRARVSPDGRYGAFTVFQTGHSYADLGQLSTKTSIVDLASGEAVVHSLESLSVTRDQERLSSPDFNFWGVTFAQDSNRFYATLATGGKTYLVEGDLGGRSARVLRENAECPSLSPDGTRIAYKKRVGDPAVWQFHVLDLATGTETPLAESRVLDDQLEWLDERNVLYRVGEEVWTVPADGSGAPRRFLAKADSPAVVG
jgi:hypothetical protein